MPSDSEWLSGLGASWSAILLALALVICAAWYMSHASMAIDRGSALQIPGGGAASVTPARLARLADLATHPASGIEAPETPSSAGACLFAPFTEAEAACSTPVRQPAAAAQRQVDEESTQHDGIIGACQQTSDGEAKESPLARTAEQQQQQQRTDSVDSTLAPPCPPTPPSDASARRSSQAAARVSWEAWALTLVAVHSKPENPCCWMLLWVQGEREHRLPSASEQAEEQQEGHQEEQQTVSDDSKVSCAGSRAARHPAVTPDLLNKWLRGFEGPAPWQRSRWCNSCAHNESCRPDKALTSPVHPMAAPASLLHPC